MNFDLIMQWFGYYLPIFFVQIVAGEAMFVPAFNRRKHFWIRVAAGLVVSVGVIFLVAMLAVALLGVSAWLISFVYIILFLYTICLMAFCVKESFFTLLFCGVAAYAIHTISYRLLCILELSGVVWRVQQAVGAEIGYLLLSYALYALIAVASYFLFVRNINKNNIARIRNVKVMAIAVVTLLITIFLSDWANRSSWQSIELTLICDIFFCLSGALILCLQSGMLGEVMYEQEINVVNELWKKDRKQYDFLRENIELINVKCHDLRFRIQSLRLSGEDISSEELAEIEEAITIYDCKVNTGCEPLDAILTEKSLYCKKNDITLTCMADASKLSFMSAGELYSLFGNIISNAIEAVRGLPDREKRLISLQVKQAGNMILVSEENYYDGALVLRDGQIMSKKGDAGSHGYGIKSMRMLVKKYNGEMKICTHGDVFRIEMCFPLKGG